MVRTLVEPVVEAVKVDEIPWFKYGISDGEPVSGLPLSSTISMACAPGKFESRSVFYYPSTNALAIMRGDSSPAATIWTSRGNRWETERGARAAINRARKPRWAGSRNRTNDRIGT